MLSNLQFESFAALLNGAATIHGLDAVPAWQNPSQGFKVLHPTLRSMGGHNLGLLLKIGLGEELEAGEKKQLLFNSLTRQQVAQKIQVQFFDQSIRFAFVKGIAQDAKYWSNLPARMYSDIDIWVHPHDFNAAQQTVMSLGYEKIRPVQKLPLTHLQVPALFSQQANPKVCSIDMHPVPFDGFRRPKEWDNIWGRTETVETSVGVRTVLPPEDEILFWAGNQLKSLFGQWPKACLDTFVMIQRENIDWHYLQQAARNANLAWPLWALLSMLNSFHIDIPQKILEDLAPPQFIATHLYGCMSSQKKAGPSRLDSGLRVLQVLGLSQDWFGSLHYGLNWLPKRMVEQLWLSR
ncbi:MAG: hypothetical protein CMH56_00580 [Myxococcales bacterium]|nr:hypothetical protein [Myxococcales bacterium]|tara:strand:+ start:3439 stop:4488 length:1050 start_codon:yes stop_codon:yes gene_type:complete